MCFCSTDLQVDSKHEARGSDNSQGLVIRGGFSVLPHGLKEGSIRDEEDDEGDKDAMEQTDEEVLVVEQRPLLPGQVQLWEFQAKFVIYILKENDGVDDEEEEAANSGITVATCRYREFLPGPTVQLAEQVNCYNTGCRE